jgi:hypothetical protein
LKEIAICGKKMVTVTLLEADGSLVAAAVIVTVFPMGKLGGAVNSAGAPSAVWAGENVPQAPPLVDPLTGLPRHIAVQSTPAPRVSFTGFIDTVAVARAASDTGCPLVVPFPIVTLIGPAFVPELLPQPFMPVRTATPKKMIAPRLAIRIIELFRIAITPNSARLGRLQESHEQNRRQTPALSPTQCPFESPPDCMRLNCCAAAPRCLFRKAGRIPGRHCDFPSAVLNRWFE